MGKVKNFEDWTGKMREPLYRFAYRLTGEAHSAEDAVSETILSVFTRWSAIREPDAYAYRTIMRQAYRTWGRRTVQLGEALDAFPDEKRITNGIEKAERRKAVRSAIGELDQHEREPLVLKEFAGMTFREIGEALSISENTVKTRIYRALGKLKHKLAARVNGALS